MCFTVVVPGARSRNIHLQCRIGLKLNHVHYNSVEFSVDEWRKKMILVKLIVKLFKSEYIQCRI